VSAPTTRGAAVRLGADPWSLRLRRFLLRRGPLFLFGGICVYLAIATPFFLTAPNIMSSVVQAAPIAIVAFGLAIVVIGGGDDVVSGGIDLSLPASAALATVIISDQLTNQGASFGQAFVLALLASLVVGVVNAGLVRIGLSSILATLATYVALIGITRVISQNRRINVTDPVILFIRDERPLGIPVPILIMLAVFAVLGFLIHRTRYGMHVQATGGNRDAAEAAGIATRRILSSTFVLASVAAAVAGVLLVARGSGSSPGIDERLLVDMVLATFVGAAFSTRNVVTILGAMLGAIFVALMANGLILVRVNNSWIDGWKGVLILVVVAMAAVQNRERR
jgi:ribose transport system permease protein